jgi:hypothetical protein
MQYILNKFQEKKYLIPIIIFFFAYVILSFNIEGQGAHQDELDFFYAYSVVYFNLAKNGDFFNPCWNGDGECELLSIKGCEMNDHWITTHGLIKHLLIGSSVLFHSEDVSKSYAPTPPLCKPHNEPIPGENVPTTTELSAARFISPILGSLTIVFAYCIGKIFFNRLTGLSFSIILLFNSLWFAYNRTIMTEAYIYFFMILSFLLLIYSFKEKGKIKYFLFVSSAIIFGIAFDTKALVFMFFPLFIFTIFLRNSINVKFSLKEIFRKKIFVNSIIISSIYFSIFFVSIIATLPFYWIGPIDQIIFQKESLDAYSSGMSLHMPWESDSKIHVRFLSTITVVFAPIIDTYYNYFVEEIPDSVKFANNFSSIPLTVMFVIGIIYLLTSIKKKIVNGSEILLIFWVTSIFLFISTMAESYSTSRFYIMMFIPMIFVAAFGFNKFLMKVKNLNFKIVIFSIGIIAHALTTMIFWEELFFSANLMWGDPLMIRFQDAVIQPYVIIPSIIFCVLILLISIKNNIKKTTVRF